MIRLDAIGDGGFLIDEAVGIWGWIPNNKKVNQGNQGKTRPEGFGGLLDCTGVQGTEETRGTKSGRVGWDSMGGQGTKVGKVWWDRMALDGGQGNQGMDYRGVLGELNEAMNTYEALGGFDQADVDLTGAVIDTHAEVKTLPQKHSDLWDVFKEVRNKNDNEAMEQHLAPEDRRHAFYEALTAFQRTLSVALGTEHFYEETSSELIKTYKDDLKRFRSLRSSVQQRYAETIDYSQYEKQIRKVMDSHIQAPDVEVVTGLVNIFDVEAFDQEVERRVGKAAKADTIASRLAKTIHEKMDEDPVFYRKFADLVEQAIADYRQRRTTDAEYLRRVTEYLSTVRRGHEVEMPARLAQYREAQAYYGVLGEVLASYGTEPVQQKRIATDIAIGIEEILGRLKRRDWTMKDDALKDMQNAIDDYLFEARSKYDISFSTTDMDEIIDRCLSIAKETGKAVMETYADTFTWGTVGLLPVFFLPQKNTGDYCAPRSFGHRQSSFRNRSGHHRTVRAQTGPMD